MLCFCKISFFVMKNLPFFKLKDLFMENIMVLKMMHDLKKQIVYFRKDKNMNEYYTINDVATMTGLTTRTVRNYIKLGMLDGEKVDGVWKFTLENVSAFMVDKNVQPSIQAKKNGVVFDFLANQHKKVNEICTILDFPVSEEEAMEITAFFCKEVSVPGVENMNFKFSYSNGIARVILKGTEDFVVEVMKKYYKEG